MREPTISELAQALYINDVKECQVESATWPQQSEAFRGQYIEKATKLIHHKDQWPENVKYILRVLLRDSHWHLNCLLCEPGTKWHPPRPHCGSHDLTAIQEHLMTVHGYTQDDLRRQTNRVIAPLHYEYVLPDGKVWLDAWKKQHTVPGQTDQPQP